MSDNWLKFIPTNPAYIPSPIKAEQARALLSSFTPGADKVSAEFLGSIQFIHPGGNWSGVRCPSCGADVLDWWKDAMDMVYKTRFSELNAVTPCCRTRISLNDLNYIAPCGFASFLIEALNPHSNLSSLEEEQLATTLGCPIRKIWVHI